MCAWPVQNCIRRLKDLCSKFMNQVVGLSMGAMVFAEWNPELCGFGWLLHLKVHASSISLLWRDDTKACVLKSHLSGLLLAPSFASWSAFSLPAMPACPGTQLIATSAFSTSFSMSPMWLLNARDLCLGLSWCAFVYACECCGVVGVEYDLCWLMGPVAIEDE